MRDGLRRFASDASGATAIEYALIAGFIAVALIVSLGNIGSALNVTFTNVNNGFSNVTK
ncbi:MAG: Flp family type IVb pilin [Beijerinckiaceae bacterium]|nr:Flp family type IVb pilin [Beijerinckiaceae bacterium]